MSATGKEPLTGQESKQPVFSSPLSSLADRMTDSTQIPDGKKTTEMRRLTASLSEHIILSGLAALPQQTERQMQNASLHSSRESSSNILSLLIWKPLFLLPRQALRKLRLHSAEHWKRLDILQGFTAPPIPVSARDWMIPSSCHSHIGSLSMLPNVPIAGLTGSGSILPPAQ